MFAKPQEESKLKKKNNGIIFTPFDNDTEISFYILPGFTAFTGIIGEYTLRELKDIINHKNYSLTICPEVSIPRKITIVWP